MFKQYNLKLHKYMTAEQCSFELVSDEEFTEGYKEKHEPLVEFTYLNANQRTYESRTMSTDGKLKSKADKYYLEYATPSERNSLHPEIDDEDLKKLLGQSFDPAVCIMPHQFHHI